MNPDPILGLDHLQFMKERDLLPLETSSFYSNSSKNIEDFAREIFIRYFFLGDQVSGEIGETRKKQVDFYIDASCVFKMQQLSMESQGLKVLSPYVRYFTQLDYLDLSHNLLKELPEGLNFPLLKKFKCKNNEINKFPEDFRADRLEHLSLSKNRLREFNSCHFP